MEKTTFNFKDIIDASMLNLSGGSALTLTDVFIALSVTFVCDKGLWIMIRAKITLFLPFKNNDE